MSASVCLHKGFSVTVTVTVTEALVLRSLLENRGHITESIRVLVPVDRMKHKCVLAYNSVTFFSAERWAELRDIQIQLLYQQTLTLYTVSQKTSPMFLAITHESIVRFS